MQLPSWLASRLAALREYYADRERRLALYAMLFVFVAYVIQLVRCSKLHLYPHGDGYYSWMHATSLALDNDIEFTNDYAACGMGEPDRGGGRPANHFYFGPALIWAPLLKLARLVVELPPGAPLRVRRACEGPWMWFVAAWTPLFTTLTIYLSYRVATRFTSRTFALMGAMVGAFGTTLVTYGAILWFYCHLWSTLGVALVMLTGLRAIEAPARRGRWLLFGWSVGFAALMRPQEALWCLLPAPWFLLTFARGARARPRAIATPLLAALLSALGFASIYWIQLVVYKKLFGVWWLVPQGTMYVQLGHAHPWLTAFSAFSGLFTYTPLVYLGVFGFVSLLWRGDRRMLALSILLPTLADAYVSASALMWHSGGSWGMRTMTAMAPSVVVGSAVFLERAYRWINARALRRRVVLSTLLIGPWAFITMGLPFVGNYQRSHWAPNAYSVALKANFDQLYEVMGNPVTLPAGAVFAARYRMHPRHFDDLAYTGLFQVYYITGEVQVEGTLHFATPNQYVVYADGCEQGPEGLRIRRGRCRFLMTLYWPFVTHLRVAGRVHASAAATVRMRANGFWTGREIGARQYQPGDNEPIEWSVPPGALDSGINEVIIESDRDITLTTMEFIERPVRRAGRPFNPEPAR